jgi:hypothetical protein
MDFDEPMYKTVGAAVGGRIEHVLPRRLEEPYCMIVNEEGLLDRLPYNEVASYLYATEDHGFPIVGDVVIMQDGWRNGERDIIGLDDDDFVRLAVILDDVQQELGDDKRKAARQCG